MRLCTKIKTLAKIPEGNYKGYYWPSNHDSPELFSNLEDLKKYDRINEDFLQEGNLYDSMKKISIQIRHIPGGHLIHQFFLSENKDKKPEIKDIELVERKYLPHKKLSKVEKVQFTEIWHPETEELCASMKVLKKIAIVFTGFEETEEKK